MTRFFVYDRAKNLARTAFGVAQQGRCAICGANDSHLHVDHEHSEMGLVRGLLCRDCNFGLGFFRDNPDFLERAIAYLAQHAELNLEYAESDEWETRRLKVSHIDEMRERNGEIRRLIDDGIPTRDVAERFGLSPSQVNRSYRVG